MNSVPVLMPHWPLGVAVCASTEEARREAVRRVPERAVRKRLVCIMGFEEVAPWRGDFEKRPVEAGLFIFFFPEHGRNAADPVDKPLLRCRLFSRAGRSTFVPMRLVRKVFVSGSQCKTHCGRDRAWRYPILSSQAARSFGCWKINIWPTIITSSCKEFVD
jgi:hypothetical protein